jgi:hypothetical protein
MLVTMNILKSIKYFVYHQVYDSEILHPAHRIYLCVVYTLEHNNNHFPIQHKTTDFVTNERKDYVRKQNQPDATKCWFIDSTCFEHYYALIQEYIGEYRFLVSKPGKI